MGDGSSRWTTGDPCPVAPQLTGLTQALWILQGLADMFWSPGSFAATWGLLWDAEVFDPKTCHSVWMQPLKNFSPLVEVVPRSLRLRGFLPTTYLGNWLIWVATTELCLQHLM